MFSSPLIAGWSSPVARQAHNLKAAGSNPAPATNFSQQPPGLPGFHPILSLSCRRSAAVFWLKGGSNEGW